MLKKNVVIIIILFMIFTSIGLIVTKFKGGQVNERDYIVLGTAADYPPYEFHKKINGEDKIVGFDIEIAKEIAKDLDLELKIRDMKFDGLLAALNMGKIDFIVAGMVPTKVRMENADFTKRYYQAEQKLLVKRGKGREYKQINDLSGLTIGVQKATVQEKVAKKKVTDGEIKSLSKLTDLVLELKFGKVDGIILAKPVASSYAKANPDLEIADINLGKEDGVAIAVKKGNQNLLNRINSTLDRLMEEEEIDVFITEATELINKK